MLEIWTLCMTLPLTEASPFLWHHRTQVLFWKRKWTKMWKGKYRNSKSIVLELVEKVILWTRKMEKGKLLKILVLELWTLCITFPRIKVSPYTMYIVCSLINSIGWTGVNSRNKIATPNTAKTTKWSPYACLAKVMVMGLNVRTVLIHGSGVVNHYFVTTNQIYITLTPEQRAGPCPTNKPKNNRAQLMVNVYGQNWFRQ